MERVMYKKNGEVKKLAQWIKDLKQYDLNLVFPDVSTRQITTVAFSEEEARHNGFYMSFGNGRPSEVQVVNEASISIKKFKNLGYTPSNIGLVEIIEKDSIDVDLQEDKEVPLELKETTDKE